MNKLLASLLAIAAVYAAPGLVHPLHAQQLQPIDRIAAVGLANAELNRPRIRRSVLELAPMLLVAYITTKFSADIRSGIRTYQSRRDREAHRPGPRSGSRGWTPSR